MALVYTFIIIVGAPLTLGSIAFIFALMFSAYDGDKASSAFTGFSAFCLVLSLILFVIFGLIASPSVFIGQHVASINLPQQYITTTQAIEEARQMIIVYENDSVNPEFNPSNMNFGQLGKGLEAIELKQRLVDLVEKRAEIKRQIRYKNRSPWVLFKPKPLSEIKVNS